MGIRLIFFVILAINRQKKKKYIQRNIFQEKQENDSGIANQK